MPFIGIDLGTTYTCVASMQRGKPEVIINEHGERTTPSCVAFTKERRMIGTPAKHQMSRNSANTVYDVKRLIGRSFDEPVVKEDVKRWPFKVLNEEGKPKIKVDYKGRSLTFAPEEISSIVLQQIKKCAEDFIGEGILGAVITVPAYFNDAQRRATKDAAVIADLHVLGLLNEPTAAAIAYGLNREVDEKRTVLIYDLGGGTFDVTVLEIDRRNFSVKATNGDSHLGGEDFNDRLLKHFTTVIAQKYGVDIRSNERAMSRLRNACEDAKKTLSAATRANIELDGLVDREDFDTHITRARFEDLNEDLFKGTLETVGLALEDADMKKDQIDEVVLVGGSTRIPMIQKMLTEYFGQAKICKTIHPDEAVALGAAAYAATLSGKPPKEMKNFTLKDVTPLSLGIATKGEVMTVVVPRNTSIPATKSHCFTTAEDNQENVTFRVFEGERPNVERNHLLGKFTLSGITPAPAGEPSFETCFDIDKDGVLKVSAFEKGGSKKGSVTVAQEGREKSEQEIKRMIEDAKKFRREDDDWKQKVETENKLEADAHKKGRKETEQRERRRQADVDEDLTERTSSGGAFVFVRRNQNLTLEDGRGPRREIYPDLGDIE